MYIVRHNFTTTIFFLHCMQNIGKYTTKKKALAKLQTEFSPPIVLMMNQEDQLP